MKPVMYIFINKGLGMTPGKMAAQASHAAVNAYIGSEAHLIQGWMSGGHYTKLVMEARDTEHMLLIERYINERGFRTHVIIDEGRTEIAPHSLTAIGVEIVNKDDQYTLDSFSSFKTYKEDKPKLPEPKRFGKLRK